MDKISKAYNPSLKTKKEISNSEVPAKKKSLQTQETPEHGLTNPMNRFSKMNHHKIQINMQEKRKAVSGCNKKNWNYSLNKVNKNNSSSDVNNTNHISTSAFTSYDEILEIPTIESNSFSKISKWSTPAEFTPSVLEVLTCDSSPKHDSTYNIPEIEPNDYRSIEVITTSNKTWDTHPLTIDEKTIPPCLSNNDVSNQCDKTLQYSNLYDSSLTFMSSENIMYEALHPSIEEQSHSWSIEPILNNSNITVIDILETRSKEAVSNTNSIIKLPLKAENNEKILFEPCQNNLKKLTDNKFACTFFNALNLTMPKQFIVKHPSDTKVETLDPKKELIPTVKNTLYAKLKKEDNKDTINVFNQEIIMKFDETKRFLTLEEVFRKNLTPENIARCKAEKSILRKTPLNTLHKINVIKSRKTVNSPISKSNNPVLVTKETNNDLTLKNPVTVTKETNNDLTLKDPFTVTKETNDDIIFKKPMIPKRKSVYINTTVNSKRQKHITSKPILQKMAVLKRNANEMRQEPSKSSQVKSIKTLLQVNANEVTQGHDLINQTAENIALLKANADEMRQNPLMKCLPFNSVNCISTTELEQNAENLATSLSMNHLCNALLIGQPSNELIDTLVDNSKASITLKKTTNRTNLVDDPIVRDYLQRTQLKTLESKRKCKLPKSMMSLPVEVLNLVPDNQREIKYIVDFYHSMATVIVKELNSYIKKSCKQGRIQNDEDFKFLAKKLNSNILFKELQVKKGEELKINDSVKQKVEQYIKKYMLQYGKVYRRKSTDKSLKLNYFWILVFSLLNFVIAICSQLIFQFYSKQIYFKLNVPSQWIFFNFLHLIM